ncbi:hypothetical protein GOBAR_AA23231 [Gossypium barbadense]|uniref:Uncharacterized protein n=1 Tax=Gossypium barbadense TaxID=3634 RepID=A0A2P5X266_GOSBA|nr:hypothetical protein GOBAR_AA23231 [Gossypium barbadense]
MTISIRRRPPKRAHIDEKVCRLDVGSLPPGAISIFGVDVRALKGPFPSMRGLGRTHLCCTSYHAHGRHWVAKCGVDNCWKHSVEEQHQSISNLVVKLYCGHDIVGEVLRKNSSMPG